MPAVWRRHSVGGGAIAMGHLICVATW
jgi:hypothetical protein